MCSQCPSLYVNTSPRARAELHSSWPLKHTANAPRKTCVYIYLMLVAGEDHLLCAILFSASSEPCVCLVQVRVHMRAGSGSSFLKCLSSMPEMLSCGPQVTEMTTHNGSPLRAQKREAGSLWIGHVALREGKVFGLLFRQRLGRHRHPPHLVLFIGSSREIRLS